MSDFYKLCLYSHNIESYQKIENGFKEQDVVGIVHATGTGKSYNALQLSLDNKDKKILYVVPSNGIIEHLKKIINDNPNLNMQRDFPNLEFKTYQSFVNLSRDDIKNIECDLLILDEFHHIGSAVWGEKINTLIDTHENIKVFGMTAYTVRDRGTSYERDMANSDTNELFSNKIVSRYDLCDAILDGVLPKPIYKSAYVNLLQIANRLELKINKMNIRNKEYYDLLHKLFEIKKEIHEAPTISDVVKRNLKPNGKYIYFCPSYSENGVNDIDSIMEEVKSWLFEIGLNEDNYVFYKTTSEMGLEGTRQRNAFYEDLTIDLKNAKNKLRIMFAINQYNEGVHSPDVDGVIMGRGTGSDIVYFEQLGRALAVRKNNKEEKLIAPVIIDLANNYEFIKELENNLKNRIKERNSSQSIGQRDFKLSDYSFDIEIENIDLFKTLKDFYNKLTITWDDYYELAKLYYEHHGNLEIPRNFKTNNGYEYDSNGLVNLGYWIINQRRLTKIDSERGNLLLQIGMRFEPIRKILSWEEMYKYAKIYYEHHGNLEIPYNFKTNNGYEYDSNGKINLGRWISTQRYLKGTNSEHKILLTKIGMNFDYKRNMISWEEMYKYAKIYYEHYGNLKIPEKFKTSDGYTYDELGINLGIWVAKQKQFVNKESERGQLLLKIGMNFEKNNNRHSWEEMYKYAKIYYEYHGNLEIPKRFKTSDGYTYDELGIALGNWIDKQRHKKNLDEKEKNLLLQIGMRFDSIRKLLSWEEMYKYAKIYYEHHGNLLVPSTFKTNNGYEYDSLGNIKLGSWITMNRIRVNKESEKGLLLSEIGIIWNTKKNKVKVKDICYNYNIDYKLNEDILSHISSEELESKIKYLLDNSVSLFDNNGKLHPIFSMSSLNMKAKYGISLSELVTIYSNSKSR